LDGKSYVLATNNTPGGIPCSLHGGKEGFNRKLWTGHPVSKSGAEGVEFSYVSPDGEEGYPGKLSAKVTYWLTQKNELVMEYSATTDKPTVVNLTNHAYWNLTADMKQPILGHLLQLNADALLQVNPGLIPTGVKAPVSGTPFDFKQPKEIGSRIGIDDAQLKLGNGYDHCWVLTEGKGVRLVAKVREPKSGRVLELSTDQPGLQFYTGNFLDGTAKGKGGVAYQFRTAFCLEPQRFPDAPNKPEFPSARLNPDETYHHTLIYKFSTE
jgi:aldose 1-epimerase